MLKELKDQSATGGNLCRFWSYFYYIYNFYSNTNGITMTLNVASYSAERFEDQVSDVVGLLTLTSTESHIWNGFTFVLKGAFIAG